MSLKSLNFIFGKSTVIGDPDITLHHPFCYVPFESKYVLNFCACIELFSFEPKAFEKTFYPSDMQHKNDTQNPVSFKEQITYNKTTSQNSTDQSLLFDRIYTTHSKAQNTTRVYSEKRYAQ